jgi:predicted NBD/HSP70 family sugar kinase
MAEGGGDADLKTVQPEKMTELLARAQAGDKAVVAAFAKAGEALGFGISRLIAIINPDRIIVAGPSLPAAEFTEKAMHQAINDGVVEELRRHVSIEYTSFNTDTIVSGTITALLQAVDRDVFAAGPIRQAVPLQVAE